MVNSDTEQEAQLLMNQGKQPALIVTEDTSSENPTVSSTGDVRRSTDDDNNKKEHGPKISDLLAQRDITKCIIREMTDKVIIRESQGEISRIF